jgi:hypothetical protein
MAVTINSVNAKCPFQTSEPKLRTISRQLRRCILRPNELRTLDLCSSHCFHLCSTLSSSSPFHTLFSLSWNQHNFHSHLALESECITIRTRARGIKMWPFPQQSSVLHNNSSSHGHNQCTIEATQPSFLLLLLTFRQNGRTSLLQHLLWALILRHRGSHLSKRNAIGVSTL